MVVRLWCCHHHAGVARRKTLLSVAGHRLSARPHPWPPDIPISLAVVMTPTPQPPVPSPPRWRLVPGVAIEAFPGPEGPVRVQCAGQGWQLDGLDSPTRDWLTQLGVRPAPVPATTQTLLRTARWLVRCGLLVASNPCRVLVAGAAAAPLSQRWHGQLEVVTPLQRVPTMAELESHSGVLVIAGRIPDRALAFMAARAGLPTVIVETGPERCRVAAFLDGAACLRCTDLIECARRPMTARQLLGDPEPWWRPDTRVAPWLLDWAATQVAVKLQLWQAEDWKPSPPAWDWMDPFGQVGRESIPPHPACCGQTQAAAAA